jgi:hypothetical protein
MMMNNNSENLSFDVCVCERDAEQQPSAFLLFPRRKLLLISENKFNSIHLLPFHAGFYVFSTERKILCYSH